MLAGRMPGQHSTLPRRSGTINKVTLARRYMYGKLELLVLNQLQQLVDTLCRGGPAGDKTDDRVLVIILFPAGKAHLLC